MLLASEISRILWESSSFIWTSSDDIFSLISVLSLSARVFVRQSQGTFSKTSKTGREGEKLWEGKQKVERGEGGVYGNRKIGEERKGELTDGQAMWLRHATPSLHFWHPLPNTTLSLYKHVWSPWRHNQHTHTHTHTSAGMLNKLVQQHVYMLSHKDTFSLIQQSTNKSFPPGHHSHKPLQLLEGLETLVVATSTDLSTLSLSLSLSLTHTHTHTHTSTNHKYVVMKGIRSIFPSP